MPQDKPAQGRVWTRHLSNNNPLYLISAWLVLHGLGQAFEGEAGLRWMPLMTQLICGYTLAAAIAGWTVVRVGRLWEDARMILLVVLLMFTAISTSYDQLCLKDPVRGAGHLLFGYFFCVAVTELLLYVLRLSLPLRFRGPYYLQLAVLFAFPAWLGRLSVDGRDPEMCLWVLAFPLAAGLALLTLWPAALGPPVRKNGTPWGWPFYPWSIFVFVAIASGIRAWMLSLSFTPAWGNGPAFMPYFLCPILLGLMVLALEEALRRRSRFGQWLVMLTMLAIVWASFPGTRLSWAQAKTLNLLEETLATPPLLICGAAAVLGVYAMLRRAAGGEFVTVSVLVLLSCLDPTTRDFGSLSAPNEFVLGAAAAWLVGIGLWTRSTLRLATGGGLLLIAAGQFEEGRWLIADKAAWATQIVVLWCALLPLYCRDALSDWLRRNGPALLGVVGAWVVLALPGDWKVIPTWAPAFTCGALACIALLHWFVHQNRWYVLSAAWIGAFGGLFWFADWLRAVGDARLRQGLAWYTVGCLLLVAAVVLSLSKAGLARRVWNWLQNRAEEPPSSVPLTPLPENGGADP